MKLDLQQFTCKPPFYENAYFVFDHDEKIFAVVDPGDGAADKTFEYIEKGYELAHVLLTHVHIDHTWDVPKLREKLPEVSIITHEGDKFWAENYEIFQTMFGLGDYDVFPDVDTLTFVAEGDKISIGSEQLTVLHVPGHSAGSIAFYYGDANIERHESVLKISKGGEGFCLVGDVVFRGNVGRADLPGGDGQTLVNSIKSKIFALPDKTILYNGHGEHTTVEWEKKHNFYVGENAGGNIIFP